MSPRAASLAALLEPAGVEQHGAQAQAFLSLSAAEESRLDGSDPDMWAEAASRWEEASEPFSVAYCRWREAEALLEGRTGRSRADDSLQGAWHVTMRLGTQPLRERIERLAQRARIPLRDEGATDAVATNGSTVGADLGLTPREVEVLGQLAAGKTDREIADALFISKKTASVHVSNLLRKLDVANRVEAGKVGQAHRLD
jgi:DNA-binding CsgD family transcriptional regulator